MLTVYLLPHGGRSVLVPDALQIGRLTAGAAAGGQNVAAKLKGERFQIRVRAAGANGLEALVRRLFVLRSVADLQMHPAHQPAEIVHVPAVERGEVFVGDGVQDLLAPGRGVAADVVVVHETGGHCHDQGDGVGVGDVERLEPAASERPPSRRATSAAS